MLFPGVKEVHWVVVGSINKMCLNILQLCPASVAISSSSIHLMGIVISSETGMDADTHTHSGTDGQTHLQE